MKGKKKKGKGGVWRGVGNKWPKIPKIRKGKR